MQVTDSNKDVSIMLIYHDLTRTYDDKP